MVDPETGDMTGIFLESAGGLFSGSPGMADATDPVAGIKAAVTMANSLGITAVHDMSNSFDEFLSVFDDGDLTVRVWQGARPPRSVRYLCRDGRRTRARSNACCRESPDSIYGDAV
jgi:predicted amidohydrolase YtcJ